MFPCMKALLQLDISSSLLLSKKRIKFRPGLLAGFIKYKYAPSCGHEHLELPPKKLDRDRRCLSASLFIRRGIGIMHTA